MVEKNPLVQKVADPKLYDMTITVIWEPLWVAFFVLELARDLSHDFLTALLWIGPNCEDYK